MSITEKIKSLLHLAGILLLFSCSPQSLLASENRANYDSSAVRAVQPGREVLEELKDDDRLVYRESNITRKSWFRELLERLLRKLFRNWTYEDSRDTANIIQWALAITAILLIVYFLFKQEINRALFYRNRQLPGSVSHVSQDDFDANNLDRMIEEAFASGNYAAAVRYLYIRSLQHLHELGLVNWTREKTNSDLVREMAAKADANDFRQLGRLFEYVHYGHFEASAETAGKAREHYNQVKRQVGL